MESRTTAIEFFQTPAELGLCIRVPQMAIRLQGELQLFDDPEVLEFPGDLSLLDAAPTQDELLELGAGLKVAESGAIDMDAASGRLTMQFLPNLQRDLGLIYQPDNWSAVELATWLCRNMPDPYLTHSNKQAFVSNWITELMLRGGYNLAKVNLQKFLIRNVLESAIRRLRKAALGKAYQAALFADGADTRLSVSDTYAYEFNEHGYAPRRDYDPQTSIYGAFSFKKHHYGRISDFDSKEEFECACWLDIQAQKGRIQSWVRNLVRKDAGAFFLQKATGRFYPDFIVKLPDTAQGQGVVLLVEYKGANGWTDAQDDRLIGGLWANLSNGKCRFVMVKDKQWEQIEPFLE